MKTVWEAQFLTLELVFTIILCIFFMSLSLYIFIKKPFKYTNLIRSLCMIVLISAILFSTFSLLVSYREWDYLQTHVSTVEGTITDFSTGQNGTESFYVNGVFFHIRPRMEAYMDMIPQRETAIVLFMGKVNMYD